MPQSGRRPEPGLRRSPLLFLTAFLAACEGVGFAPSVEDRTLNVPGDFGTIQEAIIAARDGDVIVVERGRYAERIDFEGKGIILRSADPQDAEVVAATIIDAEQAGAVVVFRSGEPTTAVLTGFTITGGTGWPVEEETFGGGVLIDREASPVIIRNVITGNEANRGAGVYVGGGASPTIRSNTIAANGRHGIYARDAMPVITDNLITENEQNGIHLVRAPGSVTLTGNVLSGNQSRVSGAGIHVADSPELVLRMNEVIDNIGVCPWVVGGVGIFTSGVKSVLIEDNTVAGNRRTSSEGSAAGGGVLVEGAETVRITGNRITGNIMFGGGGGIYVRDSDMVHIERNDITGNRTDGAFSPHGTGRLTASMGGGLFISRSSSVTVIANTIARNQAWRSGGGLYLEHVPIATITGNEILDNRSIGAPAPRSNPLAGGGGIHLWRSTASIHDNRISGNSTSEWGGAVWLRESSAALTANIMADNHAEVVGGAIRAEGGLTALTGNSIRDNATGGDGGGLYLDAAPADLEISDNRVTGNSARLGAGLYLSGCSPGILENDFDGNTALVGGGGVYLTDRSEPVVLGNRFTGNEAGLDGGAIWVSLTSALLGSDGTPLADPDTANAYAGNIPTHVYRE